MDEKIVTLPTTRLRDPREVPATFEELCLRITAEAIALCISKQRDYGRGNIDAFGEYGVMVRASDKVERLKNLLGKGGEAENESVEDTWLDLLNYGLIGLAVHRGWWAPPLADAPRG